MEETRTAVREALIAARTAPLAQAARGLLGAVGYRSPKTLDLGGEPSALLHALGVDEDTLPAQLRRAHWRTLEVVFQLTDDELPALSRRAAPDTDATVDRAAADSFLFLALDLNGRWTRSELVAVARHLNRALALPAPMFFRHEGRLTLAVLSRRPNRRDAARDVIDGSVSLIKDVDLANPHRAHVEILCELALEHLPARPRTFDDLFQAWLKVLSAQELNKRFYRELADWFAWASGQDGGVLFPPGQGNGEGEKQVGLIRLLTRLMFVWFIKEKGLVPDELFRRDELGELLIEPPHTWPDVASYYPAVLQNLFFACLNTEWGDRDWLSRDAGGGTRQYLVHNRLRQRAMFADPDRTRELFRRVPFLNGGLFDCLDVEVADDDPRAARASRESRQGPLVLRVDGFSEEAARRPVLPNRLFFQRLEEAAEVDVSAMYERPTRKRVRGLIDLFDAYKFTVEENTPLEQEAALDPELLGKVFENLLASYNEDTKTTARSKSGSFYTPRDVVDFMVDEALVAYLLPTLGDEGRLRGLLSYAETAPELSPAEADALTQAVYNCRAIDPAVGSGAFPLGLLQKLVHVLGRLDPDRARWRALNRGALERYREEVLDTPSPSDREARLADADRRLAEFDAAFDDETADYARKLFLIERCLYGVDIQPVAVQIAKLRCFISLAVDQTVDLAAPNLGVTPLPNLELKFVAANALRKVDGGGELARGDLRVRELERRLREEAARLFAARSRQAKRRIQDSVRALRRELGEQLTALGMGESDATAIARWDPFDVNAAAPFFDPEWMFGLAREEGFEGFDIVLANPPYVRQERIEDFLIAGRPANLKPRLKRDWPEVFTGTADLYVYFYARAIDLLRPGGALSFITSSRFFRAGYGAKLRTQLRDQTRIRAVIDFGDAPVFEAIAYPTIVVATRRAEGAGPRPNETFPAMTWPAGRSAEAFPEAFRRERFEMPQAALLPAGWQLERQDRRDLLARLRRAGTPLADWCGGRIYRGILTGLNEAFVIDGAKRSELIDADPASEEIIKPFLRGRDVKRWHAQPADKWLIFTRRGIDIDAYPGVRAHLQHFREALEPKPPEWSEARDGAWPGRKSGSYRWYEVQDNIAYWKNFEQPKIVLPAIEKTVAYAADDAGFYSNDKTSIVVTPRWRYLLAVTNSSVSWWITRQEFASKQGGFYEFKPMYVGALPIPAAMPEQVALIETVVTAILAGAEPRGRLEALLDGFVYALFFPEDLAAAGLDPFAAARDAGLPALARLQGETLASAAADWSRALVDPESVLYASLFAIRSLTPVRLIESRT